MIGWILKASVQANWVSFKNLLEILMKKTCLVLLCLLSMNTPLHAAENSGELRVGYSHRAFNLHFGEYNSNWLATGSSTSHLWNDFSFNGVDIEYVKQFSEFNSFPLSWGVGADLLLGTNSYEYSTSNVGSSSAKAIEVKGFVESSVPVNGQLSAFADVGAAAAFLLSDAGSPAQGPVTNSYTDFYPELYVNLGGRWALDKRSAVTASYRFTLVGFEASTDTYFRNSMYHINSSASGFYINYVTKY